MSLYMHRHLTSAAWRSAGAALVLAAGAIATGCAPARPAGPPPTEKFSVNVPKMTPQAETQVRQVKGGLEISIAPMTYTVVKKERTSLMQVSQPPGAAILYGSRDPSVYAERTTVTTAQASPDRLEFLVTINNQMPRVFHGAGAVVQFNVGGDVLPVEQRGYSSFQGAIIPPRTEQQVKISGPPLSSLKASGIIGVLFFDVVTGQNEAGVVTEKQNYTWYFNYATTPQSIDIVPTRTETVAMTRAEFQAEMIKPQQEQMMEQFRAAGVPVQPQGTYSPPPQ